MNTVTFDTYKAVKSLTSEGISEKQATVIVDAIREGSTVDKDSLATKADLSELKAELTKWMFGGFVTMAGFLVAILLKLH